MTKKLSNRYGKIMILFGILIMVPMVVVFFDNSQIKYLYSFILPGVISIILGVLICKDFKKAENNSIFSANLKNSTMLVLFSWFYCFLLGALPLWLGGQLNPIQALFESVSGYTTTGLTVVIPSQTPLIYLAHQIFMQYCGGFGVVLMFIMIIKDQSAVTLYTAEGHQDKLLPNIQKTARLIFITYNLLIIIGTGGFYILGMDVFDALCNSITSLFTAGYSIKDIGISYYNSTAVYLFSMILMILGSINTGVLLMIFQGKFKIVKKITELKFMFFLIVLLGSISTIVLWFSSNLGFFNSILTGFYNVISSLSTTGNYNYDIRILPPFVLQVMIICMLLGGCAGSTTGGLKLSRIVILLKTMYNSLIMKTSSSRRVLSISWNTASGKKIIENETIKETISYIGFYFLVMLIGANLLTITANCSLMEGFFEFASALSSFGVTIGITGPNTNSLTLIVEMVGMILGRLEIYILLIGGNYFYKAISKKIKYQIEQKKNI
ncbi:MAG TPA: potassium transporter TrkG [Erysipelotrichaceae bacterium]|nr:potassium transporter TrkG [Erysipelotrichaceae bacterium]HQA85120.1 potassium transporter TrkG [Erysipelotrichaceae bacterium]